MRGWIIIGEMGESHQRGEHSDTKIIQKIRRKEVSERFKNYDPSKKKSVEKRDTCEVCMNGTKLKQ